ncbi:MAG: P-loop NTPase [Brevinema sp.]
MIQQKIQNIFNNIVEPRTQKKLSELTTIHSVSEENNLVRIHLVVDHITSSEKTVLRKFVEDELTKEGIEALISIVTTDHLTPHVKKTESAQFIPSEILSKFKKIIAVYSTKGGVGKSTIAVELALELAQKDLKTALIDLDAYGPSVPRILGVKEHANIFGESFLPFSVKGLDMISVGSLIPDVDSALIWRAPVVNSAIRQLFTDVAWADHYDVLVLDMPPGTGDIPISVAQNIPLDTLIAVSTPHGSSLEDTVKGIAMFRKFHCDILGLVYNMGSVICEECHKLIPIYPRNKEFENLLMKYDVKEIADLPLDGHIAQYADHGEMEKIDSEGLWKKEFQKITELVIKKLFI